MGGVTIILIILYSVISYWSEMKWNKWNLNDASRARHLAKETVLSGKANQRVFYLTEENRVSLSTNNIVYLPPEEQVLKAETIQALDCVNSNYSFANANSDTQKFKAIFLDSKIAESYKLSKTKTKYVLQFRIAPYFWKDAMQDFKNQPFTFKCDKTTTR